MNTDFTEHTINNTDNNEKSKIKKSVATGQNRSYTLKYILRKDSKVKKQGKISKKMNIKVKT